jgi:DNA polymerase I-like protein with 3'-5' exonuclease and polymerase domains
VVHCIAVFDRDTGKTERYRDVEAPEGYPAADGTIRDGLKRVANAVSIGGHNIIGYDIPVMQKLYPGEFYPRGVVRDSLVESEMWYPANDLRAKDFAAHKRYGKWIEQYLFGRHSLEAWGARLKCEKDAYTAWCKDNDLDPWECWRPEMEDYCVQDTVTNAKLFDYFEKKFDYHGAAAAVELENKVAPILARQEQWGVAFDVPAAGKFHAQLVARHEELAGELRKYFTPFYQRKGKAVTPKRSLNYKDVLRPDLTEGAPYVKVEIKEFNPGSNKHVASRLRAVYGWTPKEFTPTGDPKVDEAVIKKLVGKYEPAPLLLEYLLVDKRIGQLAEGKMAWLKKEVNGRIYGRVKANGTRTTRCSHVNPNLGQVPKVSKPYGVECRSLFGPSEGRVQMGCDLSGIEMRAQGHYLARFDGGSFAREVVDGDVHDLARIALGMNSRDITKTFEYAMTYGSGLPNLGSIVYSDMTDLQKKRFGKVNQRTLGALGKARKAQLATGLTGFDKLLEAVENAYERGWLRSLDGRKLAVPSKHSALNTLFQGFGGVVAKTWLVIFNDLLIQHNLIPGNTYYIDPNDHNVWKVVQMLFVHDEVQTDCLRGYEQQAGELAVQAARATRDKLKLNVEIDAEFKLGADWSECH